MSEMELIAILTPAEGKADRVESILGSLCEYVHANEPDTLRYHLHKEVSASDKTPIFIMLETYKNSDAHAAHRTSPKFAELVKAIQGESLLAKPLEVRIVKAIAGFKGRL